VAVHRTRRPAVLQASAAPATSRTPRRYFSRDDNDD
jgi:hypothetical protein